LSVDRRPLFYKHLLLYVQTLSDTNHAKAAVKVTAKHRGFKIAKLPASLRSYDVQLEQVCGNVKLSLCRPVRCIGE